VKVTVELPGLEEKDIEVALANGILAIKACRNFRRLTNESSERWIPTKMAA
jgi:HSP20 family molecular chaperone IbpA